MAPPPNSSAPPADLVRHMRLASAVSLVVSTMVGVGIFTSTGYQAASLAHPGWIFAVWILGGALSYCGALCYAELGAAIPHAGGEYVYLRRAYGGAVGFMTAFVSLFAGFAAPIASMAKALAVYLAFFIPALGEEAPIVAGITAADAAALFFVWLFVFVHSLSVRFGVAVNDLATSAKLLGIFAILALAFFAGEGSAENLVTPASGYASMTNSGLASALAESLVFVMFTYSGWNAAAYMAGEIESPQRNVPLALMIGTLFVMALYLGLNAVYLYGASAAELAGVEEVGLEAAGHLFGPRGTAFVTAVICVTIFGAISANTVSGPRIYYAVGRDYPVFELLGRVHAATRAPVIALLLQGAVTSAIVLAASLDAILQYAGILLTLSSALAVLSVAILRRREPALERPFKAWGYPWTPILFLAVIGWMLVWNIKSRPQESAYALATMIAGCVIFYLTQRRRGGANSGQEQD